MVEHIRYKIEFEHGTKQPDAFEYKPGVTPQDSLVVAYDREGQPASRYGDDIWDMTAYQKITHFLPLNFVSWNNSVPTIMHENITAEIKWLLFLFSYFRDKNCSVGTLARMLNALRDMAKHCADNKNSPINLLSNPIEFSTYLNLTKVETKNISSLISTLTDIGETKRGFPLFLGANLKLINSKIQSEMGKNKQHPVIPTRIYSALISRSILEIEEFEAIADKYMRLIDDCVLDPQLGRSWRQRNSAKTVKPIKFLKQEGSAKYYTNKLLDQYGLLEYVESYSLRNNIEIKSLLNIGSCARKIQSVCFMLIILFSGMRRSEANRLPYECIETFHKNGRKHYRLSGETFKLTNGISEGAKWVTDPIVERAVRVAQKIARTIYSSIDVSLNAEQRNNSDYPLFIGMGYLPFTAHATRLKKKAPYSNTKDLGACHAFPENFFLKICETDIEELEAIDPFRDWRSEDKFTVGSHWHFTSHQARRSLAVYASASGLVSLQSLRRQLQHITEEMTVYYARGSLFAKDIIANHKDHFCHDYQATQPEAQALAYIAQVLMSNEPLFGGHGAFLTHRFPQEATISPEDRNTTLGRFKNGEIAYKPTPLGGCTTVEPCDKKPMRTVAACLDCGKSVIKATGVEKVIKKTKVQISRLDPESKEVELKEKDLSKLLAFHSRILKTARTEL